MLQGVSLPPIGEDRACGLFGALPLGADRPLLLVDTDKFLELLHVYKGPRLCPGSFRDKIPVAPDVLLGNLGQNSCGHIYVGGMVASVVMPLFSGVWWVGVGHRLCFPGLGHLEQSSPTGNSDIHLSSGSLDQGFNGHRCGVVMVAHVRSLFWGLSGLVGCGMGCASQH